MFNRIRTLDRRRFIASMGAMATLPWAAHAQAPAFPNRPIKVIVPWPAGGGGDVAVRTITPFMSNRLGQPVVVENRVGAIGTIGSGVAAKSPPDGYTLVYGAADSHSIAPHLLQQVPFDALKDFVAIAPIGFTPLALVVHPTVAARTFNEFVQLARSSNPSLSYGSWGVGGSGQITVEAIKGSARIDLLHVPFQGTAPLMQGQLSGQIAASILPIPVVDAHVKSGAVRVLAVVARERLPGYSDVPTVKELGIPIDMGPWFGFLAPAGVPSDIVARLHSVIDEALGDPQVTEPLRRSSVVIERMPPAAYQQFYRSEYERWGRYIKDAKISI